MFDTADGFDEINIFANESMITTQTQSNKLVQNPIALAAIITVAIGFGFMFFTTTLGYWIGFGLGLTGIALAIGSLFLKKERAASIVGIMLGLVVVFFFTSKMYGWPFD